MALANGAMKIASKATTVASDLRTISFSFRENNPSKVILWTSLRFLTFRLTDLMMNIKLICFRGRNLT